MYTTTRNKVRKLVYIYYISYNNQTNNVFPTRLQMIIIQYNRLFGITNNVVFPRVFNPFHEWYIF